MENRKERIKKIMNHFNTSSPKFEDKKEDLRKRYFYKLNLAPKQKNIFHELENGQNLDELEQVYKENIVFQKNKNKLHKKQIDCLKSMILHHKNIPERWIFQYNYKNLLSKVMQDPIVLSYAIFSKDIYKKRSAAMSIDIDDIKRHMPLSPKEPKFISYINPYSKNYDESSKKHMIRKEYGYNIKRRKNKEQNIYTLKTENNNTKKVKNNLYLNINVEQDKELPNIFGNMKKTKNKDDEKKTEDKNDLTMMTSLYYDENKLNEKKDNNNNKKDNDDKSKADYEETQEQTIKKQSIELPLIDY